MEKIAGLGFMERPHFIQVKEKKREKGSREGGDRSKEGAEC